MTARGGTAIASTALALVITATVVTSTSAEVSRERPRGAVEDCSTSEGWPAGNAREFSARGNRVVGPLALEGAGATLGYADSVGGNKLLVHVRSGHRVTLELSRETRADVGLAFGSPLGATSASRWNLRNSRRVVTFGACHSAEEAQLVDDYDEWPVTAWVGGLLASSPRCVPLLVWIDHEPSPRRTVIRFGVPRCR